MTSEVSICNTALMLLGANAITSLSEDSKAGRLCNQAYDRVRDAVLRAHPWNCAVTRADLSRLSAAPAFGFAHQYQLPSDPYCLRALELEDHGAAFRVEGRRLLTDADTASLVYVARLTDPNQFDALLAAAVAARLAGEVAYALTGSASLKQAAWVEYQARLTEARRINAQEGTPPVVEAEDWLRSRA